MDDIGILADHCCFTWNLEESRGVRYFHDPGTIQTQCSSCRQELLLATHNCVVGGMKSFPEFEPEDR